MSLRALSSLASVLRFKMIVLLIKTIVKVINTKSSMANTVFIVFSFLIGCRVRGAGVAPALEYRRPWQALADKMTTKPAFTPHVLHRGREPRKPPTGRVEQDLYMRRPLPQRGCYPAVGSIATHRSYRFVWCLRRLFGCKYHRRVSLLSFQISRPVGLVPSQDSNAGGLPVGRLGGVCCVGDLEIIETLEISDVIRHWGGHFLVEVFDVERGFCRRCGECVYSPTGL